MYFIQTPALPLCPLPSAAGHDFPVWSLGNGHPISEHSTCQPIRSFHHPASVPKSVMRFTETGNLPPPPPPLSQSPETQTPHAPSTSQPHGSQELAQVCLTKPRSHLCTAM